jgi:hypothetical protein
MVSFDVASLANRVLIMGALNLLSQHFEEDILRLFHQVLTSSFLSFSSQLNILSVKYSFTTVSGDCQLLEGGF